MLTKFAGALWSATPAPTPFTSADVTAAVAADMPPRPVVAARDEAHTVLGSTVTYHDAGAPARQMSIVEYSDGTRAVLAADA
jgi:hypothetical protein